MIYLVKDSNRDLKGFTCEDEANIVLTKHNQGTKEYFVSSVEVEGIEEDELECFNIDGEIVVKNDDWETICTVEVEKGVSRVNEYDSCQASDTSTIESVEIFGTDIEEIKLSDQLKKSILDQVTNLLDY